MSNRQTSESAENHFVPPQVVRLLLDVPTAAQTLGASPRFVRLLLARCRLPCVHLGRRVLVRRADLDSVIARGGLPEAA
jgi:excisionase family DNA binding protein